jgi:hypothetical protein
MAREVVPTCYEIRARAPPRETKATTTEGRGNPFPMAMNPHRPPWPSLRAKQSCATGTWRHGRGDCGHHRVRCWRCVFAAPITPRRSLIATAPIAIATAVARVPLPLTRQAAPATLSPQGEGTRCQVCGLQSAPCRYQRPCATMTCALGDSNHTATTFVVRHHILRNHHRRCPRATKACATNRTSATNTLSGSKGETLAVGLLGLTGQPQRRIQSHQHGRVWEAIPIGHKTAGGVV